MANELTVTKSINTTIGPVMDNIAKINEDLSDIRNKFMPKFKKALESDVFQEDPELALKTFHEVNAAQTNILQFSRQLVDSLVKAKQALGDDPDARKSEYNTDDNEVEGVEDQPSLFD